MKAISSSLALLLLASAGAPADALVTACVSDTQSNAGTNLVQALQVGGLITFQCPPNTNIRVTRGNVVRVDVTIDGGENVTLDGHGLRAILLNSTANRVVLRGLTVRGMAQPPAQVVEPGAIGLGRLRGAVVNAANAELDHVTIASSEFPVVIRKHLLVSNSVFIGNGGVAVSSDGDAQIKRSRFTGNALAVNLSAGMIASSTFTDQTRGSVRVGAPTGPVVIRHSVFSATRGDSAIVMSQRAAISNVPTVTLRANRFEGNVGGAHSGAIRLFDVAQEARERGQTERIVIILAALPPAKFVLAYNIFVNNRGVQGGAANFDLRHTNGLSSTGDLFMGNTAIEGGAVAQNGGTLQMTHALFRGNRAENGRGAAIVSAPGSLLTLANSLVAANVGGFEAIAGDNVRLANVTIADNGAVGLTLRDTGSSVVNSIFSGNRPADCSAVPPGVFRGANLQSAATCPGASTGNAFLDSLYIPAVGSPALQMGDPASCAAAPVSGSDLPFSARGSRRCALGAYEHAPLRHIPREKSDSPHGKPAESWQDVDELAALLPSAAPTSVSVSYGEPSRAPPATTIKLKSTITAPLHRVLIALAAEEGAPSEQVNLRFERADTVDVYFIARLKSEAGHRRVHLIKNAGPAEQELIAVDTVQWLRTATGWERSPITRAVPLDISAIGLFRSGLAHVVEIAPIDVGVRRKRRYTADISWSNGATRSEGRLALSIDRKGRPSAMVFEGRCGSDRCRFQQRFDYDAVVRIEEPSMSVP